ncbi:RNA polymerase sigma factor, partial [Siminovitchia sp. 179-K 8D1 HS]|uniref:RNA polymerase sigma factor n=1 Tax=Siminovitchia sp. 179-K 8D1 HS TaxID=3142385 RepID=UPI0039A2427B
VFQINLNKAYIKSPSENRWGLFDAYLDKQYEGEEGQSFQVAGKKITPKLLAEALRTLPKEKRKTVLLYYFFDKSDVEIAELLGIPRSTVQYRRTSSFKRLRRFLEEHADERSD